MGGTTFENLGIGSDAQEVFRRLSEDVAYEHGHGGYTGTIAEKGSFVHITSIPVSEHEARALANRLINEGDQRIDDKWGPAGAIPVILDQRRVTVGPFDYTEPDSHMMAAGEEARRKAFLESDLWKQAAPLVKLKRGEEIDSIQVTSYNQPSPTRPHYGVGVGGFVTNRRRTNCQATVFIRKPPLVREVEFEVTLPNLTVPGFNGTVNIDYEKINDELVKAASSNVRLKQGERIVDVRQVDSQALKSKVAAEATKGKAITRYIVKGSQQHATWATGFDSQAAAREWATTTAKTTHTAVQFEIDAVIRREGDLPLVVVKRDVTERKHKAVAVVAKDTGATKPEGWLFFGWASC